jgi:transcription initiation factor TFIIH subunit 4
VGPRNRTPCADCVRGTSNSFGVPYEPTPSDLSPSVDDMIHHGETTWEVRCVSGGPRWAEAAPRLMNQSILKYMVSSGLAGGLAAVRPRQQVLQLLHASGLMADP